MTKNEIKYLQSLSDKKNRDKEQKFIIEGPKMVHELLRSDYVVEKLWFTVEIDIGKSSIDIEKISVSDMSRISQWKTPSNMLALVHKKTNNTTTIDPNHWCIALDGIQDPGNMGTIIRIADWFGIEQIIATSDSADCFNSKTLQATMGGIFRVNIHYTDLNIFLENVDVPVYGALLEGENVFKIQHHKKGIIVIGNESKGIRPSIQKYITDPVSIPRIGNAESLNAAVATGIIVAQFTQL